MANVTMVPRKLKVEDVIPNYDFQLGIPVNEESASQQKQYFEMFLNTNFEIIESLAKKIPAEQLQWYLTGMKDAIAFVNLWIDSLNTLESDNSDITE